MQIACVSKKTFNNIDEPTAEEISQHVLSGVTLADLETLNLQQFKSLYKSQWAFVPGDIKNDALSWRLDPALRHVLDSAKSIKNQESDGKSINSEQNKYLKTIEDTLSLILEFYRDDHQTIPDSALVSFINSIKDLHLQEIFLKIFE